MGLVCSCFVQARLAGVKSYLRWRSGYFDCQSVQEYEIIGRSKFTRFRFSLITKPIVESKYRFSINCYIMHPIKKNIPKNQPVVSIRKQKRKNQVHISRERNYTTIATRQNKLIAWQAAAVQLIIEQNNAAKKLLHPCYVSIIHTSSAPVHNDQYKSRRRILYIHASDNTASGTKSCVCVCVCIPVGPASYAPRRYTEKAEQCRHAPTCLSMKA